VTARLWWNARLPQSGDSVRHRDGGLHAAPEQPTPPEWGWKQGESAVGGKGRGSRCRPPAGQDLENLGQPAKTKPHNRSQNARSYTASRGSAQEPKSVAARGEKSLDREWPS